VSAALEIARIAAVIVLLGVAAAIATPKGRLPLALRGLARSLGRPLAAPTGETRVSGGKRLLALFLVLGAVALAVI